MSCSHILWLEITNEQYILHFLNSLLYVQTSKYTFVNKSIQNFTFISVSPEVYLLYSLGSVRDILLYLMLRKCVQQMRGDI